MDQVKKWAKRGALVVFLTDVYHVYTYLNEYYKDDDDADEKEYSDEKLREDQEILELYTNNCATDSLVSDEDFEKCVQELLDDLERTNPDNSGIYPLGEVGEKVMRESIVFAGGGRASFQQLAHPFIASGIRMHSMLERGVSRRFYNTFKYMFGMTFGTRQEMAKAAKAVRHLHAKVKGPIGEDVGIFTSKSRFDAAQRAAMKFVGATLLETAVFEYEMHVALLTEAEKDHMVRAGPRLLMLFGIRPSASDPQSWKEFRRHMSAMWRSKVLTVSESAKDTTEFLLLPPSPVYRPLLDSIQWSTAVSLPPRLAKQFVGRTPSWFDRFIFAIFHAMIRFIYRLTPGSWRYLSAYWRMVDRVKGPRNILSTWISTQSANFSNSILAMAMPERDPDEAARKVKEKRQQRVVFEKVPGSPLRV